MDEKESNKIITPFELNTIEAQSQQSGLDVFREALEIDLAAGIRYGVEKCKFSSTGGMVRCDSRNVLQTSGNLTIEQVKEIANCILKKSGWMVREALFNRYGHSLYNSYVFIIVPLAE